MCIEILIDKDSNDKKRAIIHLRGITEQEKIQDFIKNTCPDHLQAIMVHTKDGVGISILPRESFPDEIRYEIGDHFGDSTRIVPWPQAS